MMQIKLSYLFSIFTVSLVCLLMPVGNLGGQDDPVVEAETKAEATKRELIEEDLLQVYGWLIGQEKVLYIGYTDEELQHIVKGFVLAAKGAPAPENLEEVIKQVEAMIRQRLEAYEVKQAAQNTELAADNQVSEEAFFAEIGKIPGIQKTESGIYYEKVDEGIGRKPSGNDWVRLHYTGRLINGVVFDSSIKRGKPTDFNLTQLIPGFAEGLSLVRESGKIKLYIPSRLAYRDQASGNIPPGSTLIFDVELIEVNPIDLQIDPQR